MASTITVELVGDWRKLQQVFQKVDQQSQTLGKRVAKGFDNVGRSLQRVGTGLTVGVTAPIALMAKQAVASAEELSTVRAITAQVIQQTGGAAKVTATDVATLTKELETQTGVDDKLIQAGSNILLTFKDIRNEAGKGNDIFNRANEIMLDLATVTGTDATSAATQLGKALNDPIKGVTALRRVGVSFTQQQIDQIKILVESGDILGAQKLILAELETQYGGTAEASANATDKMAQSWENIKERLGTVLLPFVDTLQQRLENLAKRFENMSDEQVQFIVKVAGIAAAAGPALIVLGSLARAVAAIGTAVSGTVGLVKKLPAAVGSATSAVSKLASVGFGPLGAALAAGTVVLGIWLDQKRKAQEATEDYTAAIEADSGALADNTKETAVNRLEKSGLLRDAQSLGVGIEDLVRAVLGEEDAYARVTSQLNEHISTSEDWAGVGGTNADTARRLAGELDRERGAVEGVQASTERTTKAKEALGVATDDQTAAAGALEDQQADLGEEMADTKSEADKLREAIDALTGKSRDAAQAEIDFEQALDDATQAAKDNKKTLDTNREAGRKNREELIRLAERTYDHVVAQKDLGASTKDLREITERARRKFIDTAVQMGATRGEAKDLWKEYGKVPKNVKTDVSAPGLEKTKNNAAALNNALRGISATVKAREFKQGLRALGGGDGLGIDFPFGLLGTGGGSLLGISPLSAVGAAYSSMGRPGDVISGFRPGSRTLSGNLSYHAQGRALDITPIMSIALAIRNMFGARTKELITPWFGMDLLNGRPWTYSSAVKAQHSGSRAHIHWAMGGGGLVNRPGRFLVGDSGMEIVNLARGDSVTPLDRAPATAGRGGTTVIVHVHGSVLSERDLVAVIRKNIRNLGGLTAFAGT
jgi:hypothetical protein